MNKVDKREREKGRKVASDMFYNNEFIYPLYPQTVDNVYNKLILHYKFANYDEESQADLEWRRAYSQPARLLYSVC